MRRPDDFTAKPFSPVALLEKVAEVLGPEALGVTTATDAVWALSAAAGLPLGGLPARVQAAAGGARPRSGNGAASVRKGASAPTGARGRFRRSIAISVSGMFRDPEQFHLLEHTILPVRLSPGRLAVWSAGCADGTVLFSVAALLARAGALEGAMLLGSDLLAENVELARPVRGELRVGPERLFDAQELVGHLYPVGPRGRARLDLAAARGRREVGDRGVLRLPGSCDMTAV